MKKTTKTLLSLAIISTACYLPYSFAATVYRAQACKLGDTCSIPGADGGQTHFNITPKAGLKYQCDVKSDAGSLKFSVMGGGNFSITHGDGFYNANPTTSLTITGRFTNPDNPNEKGEIKFTKVPLTADGSVKCYAKK